MLQFSSAILGLACAGTLVKAAQTFTLSQNHSGSNFLDNWTFYNGIDANTTGNVLFQTKEQAEQYQLTYLNPNGNFIVKVDNTTNGASDPNYGRASVKLLSAYTFSEGSLILFDAVHLPFGCSVWPAFWSQGQIWPDDGEIDIIEGVNLQTQNDISLHTLNGCTHPDNTSSSSIETGNLISTDCFNQTNGNQGCIVEVPGASYGESFSTSGGGVYALNWNTSGLYLWFFPRSSIPSDLPTDSPNPDGWGLPTASYPSSSCDQSKIFQAQTLILDITLCGNFAGAASVFTQTCSGTCTDLVQDPSNYNNAYFEISYIRVFEQSGTDSVGGGGIGASGTTSAGGSTSTSSTQGSMSTSISVPLSVPLVAAFLLGISLLTL